MKKQLKKKLFARAKKLGRDWDGDAIKYRGRWFAFNMITGKVKEVKFDEHFE
jgi:hypothetical protein